MKIKILFLILLGAILFATTYSSCTKKSDSPYLTSLLAGKWKILYDSSCNEGFAVGGIACNIFKSSVPGGSDAYYSFTPNGKLYIKEGNIIDTATYLVLSSDTLTVSNSYPHSPVIFYVANFISPDSLTLISVGYDPMPIGIAFLNHVGLSRK